MADDGVIAAFLRELAYSVARLPDAADIVAEAEDHLYEAADHLVGVGRSRTDAEAEAIARFGSAALIARICVIEAKRGASVPTTRTRAAGLAALLTPVLLVVGQYLNVTVDHGFVHGIGVISLTTAIPAFVFALWGLRARHGGLGQLGKIAIVSAVISPFLSFIAGYAGVFAAMGLLGLAVIVLVVEMLRANVLPVVPLVLLATGPAGVLAVVVATGATGGDAGGVWFYPLLLTAVGYLWLGWYLWREPAVDATHRHSPLATT
ncbi:MAG TPA: permease prefix domain 1-containing protein [Acidimicrobiales bacterium]|nr:permease prefix domain 1-containing protein [Acidimicrobiales bacterium]